MKIEIGIPTKNRPRVLGRCLASLLDQTYTDWDLTIINDSPDTPLHPITEAWMVLTAEAGHRVQVVQAGEWGQVAGHNWVLYHTEHGAILRLDDDILLNRDALAHLVTALRAEPEVGAVAGLYFYASACSSPDERGDMPKAWAYIPPTDGKVRAGLNSHRQQVSYHFNRGNEPQEVEHLYSSCLYRTEAMQDVGGWPEVYSQGVACGEETEGTYKLHLAGWKLLVIPQATGVHLWASGGIRSQGQEHVAEQYRRDSALLTSRLPELRATRFDRIKVGLFGQFHYGIGGAQKLFYQLLSLLQQVPGLDVCPIFRGPHYSPDEAQELFGCRYEPRAEPPLLDVQIAIGHQALIAAPARRYIQYTLFPDESGSLNVPAQYVGISPFTSEWIQRNWGKEARTVYPLVRPIPPATKREPWILIVGRLEPAKGYKELIQTFLDMRLEGWQLHIVGVGCQGFHLDYEAEIEALAAVFPNVVLHRDLSLAELEEIYGKASILWAAKGIRAWEGVGYHPNLCEHYGKTPIEAATAGCVPVAFDDGGHRYTVIEMCRWKTFDELKVITRGLVESPQFLEVVRRKAQELVEQYTDEEAYLEAWIRLIRRVHGMAVDCREPKIEVLDAPLKIGCVVDHPALPLGFAVVAAQVLRAFHEAGHEVVALGSHAPQDPTFGTKLPYKVWPAYPYAPDGLVQVGDFLQAEHPDLLWINKDIGQMGEFVALAREEHGFDGPIVGYFPVEGLPLWRGFINIIRALNTPVTYLRFGAEAIKKASGLDVEWLPHGIDHAPFRPLPDEERQELRESLGWGDRFVVGYVGRNKRVKAQWRLIYAASLLKKMGMGDLQLYLHCQPTEYGWNEGYDLTDIVTSCGVQDIVTFPPGDGHGVPFEGEEQQKRLGDLSLIELYNCFDLYVHPAEVEGFGLPPLEAAACGVPVAITNDRLAMTEVMGDAAILMPIEGKSMWFTMAQLANVNPGVIAETIMKARGTPGRLEDLRRLGLERAAQFRWEPTCQRMVEIVAETVQTWKETH